MAARMGLLLRRMPSQRFRDRRVAGAAARIEQCTECGHCASRCPYGMDTPALLKRQRVEVPRVARDFQAGRAAEPLTARRGYFARGG